jgi:hypothetical protein
LATSLNERIKVRLGKSVARALLAPPDIDVVERAIGDEGGYLFVGDVQIRRRLIERQQFRVGSVGDDRVRVGVPALEWYQRVFERGTPLHFAEYRIER